MLVKKLCVLAALCGLASCGGTTDNGFLLGCLADTTVAQPVDYKDPGQPCKTNIAFDWQGPQEIKWARRHFPLALEIHKELGAYTDSVKEAVAAWNRELDGWAFQVVPYKGNWIGREGVVVFSLGSASGDAIGQTLHWGSASTGVEKAEASLIQPGDLYQAYRAAFHELGHVLGLAHDDTGVMAPQLSACDGTCFFIPRQGDIDRLNAAYF